MSADPASVLEARARVLARPRALIEAGESASLLPVVVVEIGGEPLAVPLAAIVSICVPGAVTPLPHAVRPVHGVTAWRGRPLTVLSLDSPGTPAPSAQMVVLGGTRRATVGLLVDAVGEVDLVERETLSPARAGARRAVSMGMTPAAVLVLDADALLAATGGDA